MKGAGGFHSMVDKVVQLQNLGYEKKYGYLHTEDEKFDGKNITVAEGHTKINLSSCSYLGLEFHPTVKDSAKEAID